MGRLRDLMRKQVGRRGAFLLFLSLLDFLYGWSILVEAGQLSRLDMIVPIRVWGWTLLLSGLFLFVGALVKHDQLFYGWSAFLKAAFAGAWVSVWVNDPQLPRVWVNAVIWGAFAALVAVVSTWPEVVTLKPGKDDRVE